MNLKEKHKKEVIPALREKFSYKNDMASPRILKVTLNVGLGASLKDDQYVETVTQTLQRISGQRPIATKARKSIAGFKIREGMPVGLKVTMRGKNMYDFVEKLIRVTLPRVRDFRGISPKVVDRSGGMAIGFREHLPFPEINPDEVDRLHGLEVVITTSAVTRDEGFELFKLLGFPFKKN